MFLRFKHVLRHIYEVFETTLSLVSSLILGIPSGLSEPSICFKKSIFFFDARKMIAWSAQINRVSDSS